LFPWIVIFSESEGIKNPGRFHNIHSLLYQKPEGCQGVHFLPLRGRIKEEVIFYPESSVMTQ